MAYSALHILSIFLALAFLEALKSLQYLRTLNLSFKAWPTLNDPVQAISWTTCTHYIAVSLQCISSSDEIFGDSTSDETLSCIKSSSIGSTITKGSYKADADGDGVVGFCMCSMGCPSSAFIHNAVLSNQEIVADVTPVSRIHMVALYIPGLCATCRPGTAEGPFRVVDDHIRNRSRQPGSALRALPSPLSPAYNGWTTVYYKAGR